MIRQETTLINMDLYGKALVVHLCYLVPKNIYLVMICLLLYTSDLPALTIAHKSHSITVSLSTKENLPKIEIISPIKYIVSVVKWNKRNLSRCHLLHFVITMIFSPQTATPKMG
jgi:hypothetical protein